MAEGAIILMPLVRAVMDPEVIHTVGILIKIVSSNNCGLDTSASSLVIERAWETMPKIR